MTRRASRPRTVGHPPAYGLRVARRDVSAPLDLSARRGWPLCVAPDEYGLTCDLPATTRCTVEGLICHLCAAHAAELDSDPETT